MQKEIDAIAAGLVEEARRIAGDVADNWSTEDREKVLKAGAAVAEFGVLFRENPDLAEITRPIAESIIARLKSIGAKESGSIVEKFFAGALKVLEIAGPILIKAAIR